MQDKSALRLFWKTKIASIPAARRIEAADCANKALISLVKTLPKETLVLSFASLGQEIDLWPLNRYLIQERMLVLPRVSGKELILYQVDALSNLIKSAIGILEPSTQAKVVDPKKILFAIIPALAFDSTGQRLGFGGGFYDRLLPLFPSDGKTYGVGFIEQQSPLQLPVEPHDIPVKKVLLF